MQRFKNIICVTTPDADNVFVLERATALAKNNQAHLTVVEVIDKIPSNITLNGHVFPPADMQTNIASEHEKRLEELVAPWKKNIEIQIKVLIGTPFLEIIREILCNGHDLIIKTAESGGLLDRMFGSNDMHLLRKCPCPVWLVKPKSAKTYQRILAMVDVDDDYPSEELTARHRLNIQILEMASSLALSESAELHIVYAWDDLGESAIQHPLAAIPKEKIIAYVKEVKQQHRQNLNHLMDEAIKQLEPSALEYLNPRTHLLKGSPRNVVSVFADEIEADLVIMGTVARTGIPGFFMGNTAETILNQLTCSVLAVKPPGFITPVTPED